MSAEILRRAAALMRERAEAASPGPWRFTDSETIADVWDGGLVIVNPNRDPIANICDEWYESDPGEPAPVDDARHIASWHLAVALAVAGLLDAVAEAWPISELDYATSLRAEALGHSDALSAARAYLGEQA